jgi:YfiH family protein
LGIPPDRVYSLVQVHSRDVFTLGDPRRPGAPLPESAAFVRDGDGMVSFSRRPVPALTVADCLPVFALDREKGFFAACHSGWKGTGIALKALELMKAAGTRPEAAAAVLGPCIRNRCYRVDGERAAAFEAEFGPGSPHIPSGGPEGYPLGPVVRREGGGFFLDLQAANARLLAAVGVRHIAYCEDCTFTDERLGSFRREGPAAYTRMAALAGYF